MTTKTAAQERRLPVVLVVDDDSQFHRLIAWQLQDMELNLRRAHDGLEATLRIGDFTPDLVILDMEMPGVSGMELIKLIRMTPEMDRSKILVVTGKGGSDVQEKALLLGANAYIAKPYDPWLMKRTVSRLIHGAQA